MGKGYVHYLVDLRVLNAVPLPVYITQATFRATKPYLARELASSYEASIHDVERDLITGATRATMYAGDAKHYMFHLYRHLDNVPRPETFVNSERGDRSLSTREESDMRHLGHITISWRSSLGETGHIENTVTAHVPDMKAPKVEVKIHSTPSEIRVHQPFTAHIATRNNSAQAMRLYLQVRRDMVGEIVPMGVSGVSLGEIAGGEVAECCLVLMGLVKGVHSISGVRVVDVDSKTCYKADVVSCLVT